MTQPQDDSMMGTVSVVMATFSGASFIDEQLLSLAAQTSLPFELIVSDDGSADGTLDIVDEFRKDSPFPVTVVRNDQRLGYGENFLKAASLADGEYIAFCDQDDVWHPDKLATALERLSQTDADLFVHTVRAVDRDRNVIGLFSQGIRRNAVHSALQLAPWSVFYGCSMVFPKNLLTLVDPARRGRHTFEYQGMLSHDLWVYFLATSLGTVVLESRPLLDYRQHHGNATPHAIRAGSRFRAWTSSLGLAADPKLARNEIARGRSAIMDELSIRSSEVPVRQAAKRAAAYWRTIARYEDARLELYSATGVPRRVQSCFRLVRFGGYRAFHKGGLGHQLLLKDLLVGVLQARRWNEVIRRYSQGIRILRDR